MKTKFVGFDWDSTLAKMPQNSWNMVEKELGCESEDRLSKAMFDRREIDYATWCRLSFELYKRFNLNEAKMRRAMANLALHEGAIETINKLRSMGVKVGIISGGIYNMYECASKKFGLKVDYVSFGARFIFDKRGRLIGSRCNSYDYEGKLDIFKIFCKRANTTVKKAFYIGDSDNDVYIFKASNGIAFVSDSEELKRHAKYIVDRHDLREVLRFIP